MADRGVNLIDLSGTIAAGGTAQPYAGFNSARRYVRLFLPDTAAASLWVNDKGGTASNTDGKSFELKPGQMYEPDRPGINAISIFSLTTGIAFEGAEG